MADPIEVLLHGVEQKLHPGGQICVLQGGRVLLDRAVGEAIPGRPMREDSIVQWYSAGKPLTAIVIAQLWEQKQLGLDDRVSRFVPEFAQGGKEQVTIRHLLTHTAGFRGADKISADLPWEEAVAEICATTLEPDWTPGLKAGYSTLSSWHILGEIARRITSTPFDVHIRKALFEPLGMHDTWLRLPLDKYREYGDRIALMYETPRGAAKPAPLQDAVGMTICRPGSSARGPVRELARFYEMLGNGGSLGSKTIVREDTVQLFTSRQRVDLYDHTFMHKLDMGLGFIVNSRRHGVETVPYGYGRYASEETYGHSGAQSSCGFYDPARGVAAAWVVNGMPGERMHQARQRAVNNAIYETFAAGTGGQS